MREMKDSGVEWIGEIPKHWELIRIKDRYTFQTGFTPDTKVPSFYADSSNDGFEWITISDLSDSYYIPKETKSAISKEFVDMYHPKIVRNGSLLYSFKLSVGKVAFADRDIYTNEAIASFSVSENNSLKWLYYASFLIEYNANVNIYGARLLNQELINNSYTLFPPLSEQQAIATYLDNKCSEIDAIVSELEQQISILESYKKSIITETVTKGLNPDVEMKDSRKEWIGNIPVHWEYTRIKNIATLAGRIGWQGLTSSEYCDEGALLITGVDFYNGLIKWDSCVHIPMSRWEEAKQVQIEEGDLLITKDGTVGKIAIATDVPCATSLNSGVMVIRLISSQLLKKYLFWILKSDVFWSWFNIINAGNSTIIHLYQGDFYNFDFSLPPPSEQQAIASYLDYKCTEIDAIISEKKKQVEIIKEYKKSLIYEYVTGKKEVPSNE